MVWWWRYWLCRIRQTT